MGKDKVRMNIWLDKDLRAYVEEQAKLHGIAMSGFISICIAEHRKQSKAVDSLEEIIKKLKEIGGKENA